MRLGSVLPPLGWVVAVASAILTSFWLRDNPDIESDQSAEETAAAEPGAPKKEDVRLPEVSDPKRANELFASRPLLAEGRHRFTPQLLQPEPEAPPEPVETVTEPTPPPPDPPSLVMLGTLEVGGVRRVLLRDQAGAVETWYRSGDMIGDWAVVEILPDRVRLQLQDAEITFNLFVK